MIANLLRFLAGKKTYIVVLLGVIYALGIKYWHWPNEEEIWAGLGFTGLGTLRAAIAKLCRQIAADSLTPPRGPFIPLVLAGMSAVALCAGGCAGSGPGSFSGAYTDSRGIIYRGGVDIPAPTPAPPHTADPKD